MDKKIESNLIAQSKQGDTKAFAQLIKANKGLVYTLCLRMLKNKEDAEELAQDTFVRAYKSLKKFRAQSKMSTWLYTIAYRLCLNHLEKNGRNPDTFALTDAYQHPSDGTLNGQELMEQNERRAIIQAHIQALSPKDAALIGFYYYDDMSIQEIADLTKLSQSNIKVRIHRSRKTLRERMSRDKRLIKSQSN